MSQDVTGSWLAGDRQHRPASSPAIARVCGCSQDFAGGSLHILALQRSVVQYPGILHGATQCNTVQQHAANFAATRSNAQV